MSQAAKSSKPPKLRAACNQCNATKTKCSGERTGCSRCQTLQVDCVYAESRVGRVPGVRGKRRQKPRENAEMAAEDEEPELADMNNANKLVDSSNPTNEHPSMEAHGDFFYPHSQAEQRKGTHSSAEQSFNDVVLNWSAELTEPQIDIFNQSADIFGSLSNVLGDPQPSSPASERRFQRSASRTTFSQAGSDFQVPSLDLESRDGGERPQFSLAPSRHFQQTSFSSKGLPRRKTQSGSHSQCIATCSNIIIRLEKYLTDELKALDLIFEIIKKVLTQLNPLAEVQFAAPRDTKCLTLFGVIAHQVIELLESGCNHYFAEEREDDAVQTHTELMSASLPSLGFGSFPINPEDHKRLKSQILLEELQPITQNLGKIITLVNSDEQRAGYHREMHTSLNVLVETARRRGGL
ncbi:hypothetical protein BJ875DRAFT_487494 [Amylocarpus encephaloides]|uniref:Zn(2)-C6 fungal-type domain-containing protein n=1 Tax=Amylocarpus encephaloides TaxID=45428 RepID=A0A9P7YCR6_9HELO|nr:hypothetical protein BJ875DRAFT_487494 [Amylocarpus encephaloides]